MLFSSKGLSLVAIPRAQMRQVNPQYETAFSFSRGGSFEQGIDPVDNWIARRRGRSAFRVRVGPVKGAHKKARPLRAARKQVGPVRAAHKVGPSKGRPYKRFGRFPFRGPAAWRKDGGTQKTLARYPHRVKPCSILCNSFASATTTPSPSPSFRAERADFLFPFHSSERVGLRREKSLFACLPLGLPLVAQPFLAVLFAVTVW